MQLLQTRYFYRPTNEVCEGYVFTGVCLSTGGVRGREGRAWWGACMAGGGACIAGGHVWHGACLVGGHAWWGACMARGCAWQGAHAWQGGMCGRGHAWQILQDTVIPSMSGRYASYWNAFLFGFNLILLVPGKVV